MQILAAWGGIVRFISSSSSFVAFMFLTQAIILIERKKYQSCLLFFGFSNRRLTIDFSVYFCKLGCTQLRAASSAFDFVVFFFFYNSNLHSINSKQMLLQWTQYLPFQANVCWRWFIVYFFKEIPFAIGFAMRG